MGGFFKMFFASLLALIIFSVIGFFLFLVLIAGLAKSDAPLVEKNSVLVINIGQSFQEQKQESPLATFSSNDELSVPGVYDVVRLIQKATKDEKIKGIYLQSGINPNGFATSENRLQTSVWLGDLYAHFLLKTSEERKIDTATLHQYANEGAIKTPQDAVDKKLIDGVRYDDQIKDEIKEKLKLGKYDKINFISINSYFKSGSYKKTSGEKIALIYAEGNIVDGGGEQQGQIASADYIKLVRKARLDKTIKAIVFRVNSGGGSALASETIWRERSLAKAEKPVVVSFGDVAASGGYYISCGADSIFASPTTITGSIGVFGIIPNMEGFFKNKLGVTFDGVKTAPYADLGAIYRPMNENEKKFVQQSIDEIYVSFKQRVADGRKKSVDYVDSIAQGRVWSGNRAIGIGLIDKFGGLQDAVDCAARMAKVSDYHLREYPETQTIFDRLFGAKDNTLKTEMIRKELGEDQFKIYNEMLRIKQMTNSVQTRLPFEFFIN